MKAVRSHSERSSGGIVKGICYQWVYIKPEELNGGEEFYLY